MYSLREKFIANGIPYDDIDPEMIELLDVLNFRLGIKTKFCCYGHVPNKQSYIIFDESVTDEAIYELAEQTGRDFLMISFYKWVRHYPVKTNWKLEVGYGFVDPNDVRKKQHIDEIVECLKRYEVTVAQ